MHPEGAFFGQSLDGTAVVYRQASCYFFIHNQLHTKALVESKLRAVCYHWHSQHMYLYTNAIWCAHRASSEVRSPSSMRLMSCRAGGTPLYNEWKAHFELKAEYYNSHDLEETRQEIYDEHRTIPKLTLDHKARLTKLRVPCSDGTAVILKAGENAEQVSAFLERHNIGYRGQSLSAACYEVFMQLIRPKRERPSAATRRKLVASQNGLCAMCQTPLEAVELDHICELSQQVSTAKQTFQALCHTCHQSRSDSSETRPENPILSYFSPATYEAFVKNNPKPCLLYTSPSPRDLSTSRMPSSA